MMLLPVVLVCLLREAASCNPFGTDQSLIDAARAGDLDQVNSLLQEDSVNINNQDDQGKTAVNLAAEYGHNEVVKALVEHNADLNVQDRYGLTGVSWAVDEYHYDTFTTLLESGAAVDLRGNDGRTALHRAACLGQLKEKMLGDLLSLGANVNNVNDNGETPLMYGAGNGCRSVIPLLEHGASVELKNNAGETALMKAADGCRDEAIAALLQYGASKQAQDNEGKTARDYAGRYCSSSIHALLQK